MATESNAKNEFKPCPFCGNDVFVWDMHYGVVSVIECKTCKVRFVFAWNKSETKKDLADNWNRRVIES